MAYQVLACFAGLVAGCNHSNQPDRAAEASPVTVTSVAAGASAAAVPEVGVPVHAAQAAALTGPRQPSAFEATAPELQAVFYSRTSSELDRSTVDDPTDPDETTGKHIAPPADFDEDLATLLTYNRSLITQLTCPGLLESAGCGDGECDSLLEDEESCPADCVFHLAGAYNDLPICPSYMEVYEPTSIEEIQQLVREAVQQGKRIRVLGASHSASTLICGDGVALRMTQLASLDKTEIADNVARVQPGVLMIDLGDYLYERNFSIGYTHLGFRGVTVAGVIGTSAHGSSPKHYSALSQRVVSLEMVMADGSIRNFEKADTDPNTWRALTTHLGLFGVITRVGLQIEPAFNLDTQVVELSERELLDADSPLALVKDCDWGQLNWFPGQHKVLRWCGNKSSEQAVLADNVLLDPGVDPALAPLAKLAFHAGTCGAELNALLEEVRYSGLADAPPIIVTDGRGRQTHTDHAVGPAHRMMSADLIQLDANKYFQMDWEVAIPEQYMADAVRVARQVFDAHSVALPGVGVFMRFTKIEKGGWLSYHSAGKQFAEGQTAMFFEMPVAVPAGYSDAQLRDYLNIYEQLVSLYVRYYGARGHWGKNLDAIFDLQRSVGTYAGRIEKINDVVAELDPYGVFSNDFAARIGVRWPKQAENFAAELGGNACSCDVTAEPVCDYRKRQTYANTCRAACAGLGGGDVLTGPCAAFAFSQCSALDGRTCIYRKRGRSADPGALPVLRY